MSAKSRDVLVMVCFTLTAVGLMVGGGQLWLVAQEGWQSSNPWIYVPAGAVLVVGAIIGFIFTIFMGAIPDDKRPPVEKNDQNPSA